MTSALAGRTVGFIGMGNMGEALARGMLNRGLVEPAQLSFHEPRADHAARIASEIGIRSVADNAAVLAASEVVVLAIKPQMFAAVADSLRGAWRAEHCVVSILAGTTIERIEAALTTEANPRPRVIRTMPNTPALIGEGATGLAPGRYATEADLASARAIFEAVGVAEIVAPELLDAITGLTGSGPAYVFRLIEGLLLAAESQGIPPEQADKLVKRMVLGAARLAYESPEPPAELRRRVTSPGGTTQAGLETMDRGGFVELVQATVDAATKRSKELAKG